jgi:hypothetical protein
MSRFRHIAAMSILALACGNSRAVDLWGQEIFHDAFEDAGSCPSNIILPDGSERSLLVHANITYGNYPQVRPYVDVRFWDNVWGYNNTVSPQVGWPGVGGAAPVIGLFPRVSYTAAHFHTPVTSGSNGSFSNPSYVNGPPITMAISRRCGDFDDYMETVGCLARDVPTSDAVLVRWKFTANAPGSFCNLQPDTDYYVNVIIGDPASTDGCPAWSSTCTVGTVSYHN